MTRHADKREPCLGYLDCIDLLLYHLNSIKYGIDREGYQLTTGLWVQCEQSAIARQCTCLASYGSIASSFDYYQG
jgi:hypothetical protein